MSRNRWLNIAALSLIVLAVSCSGMQPQVIENTPTSSTEEPSPTEPSSTPTEAPTSTLAPTETPAEKVQIVWFIGLGAENGTTDQIAAEQEVADQFNVSQERIELVMELHEETGNQSLTDEIAYGNTPDIIGPIGIVARDRFKGEWLDLTPLIEANQYDLSDFDPVAVKFLQVEGEGQLAIPFMIYPSFIFVNKDLFDKAGLPYPPQDFGAPYIDDKGEQHEWNMDTLRDLAMRLTVDRNGNDATSPDFDPEHIVQFGFFSEWTDMRGALTMFGPGNLVDEAGKAQMPDYWREGAHWIYDAMWKDHFWPTAAYREWFSFLHDDYGNTFRSGHLAMAQAHMWYAAQWTLGDIDFVWDTAVMPSYHGTTTAKMHTETFYIMKSTQHPQEAFEVLSYMLSKEYAPELLDIYGGMPARLSLQDAYFQNYGAKVFPGQDINWQVVIDSTSYADIPNHESWLPNRYEAESRIWDYWLRWAQEPNLDVDAEIDALLVDLQAIFDSPN